ncbi:uncharacterized protein ARMOST_21968 [Armillaria ostoyae]|uniref:Fungal N-terminal domain-containing protein n=1 Tax=Armillaria ostoyae TaxID=47428 RepID=A0A284SBI9_ARMOS|nr:uncharacterized protein ARMOST_21968 [Armillaria ostoyae]
MGHFTAYVLVAKLAEATGVPYLENVAKAAVAVIELLEKVKTNKHEVKELCESIANTVTVINSHVASRKGEERAEYFAGVCGEMERCLNDIAEHVKDEKRKRRGLKGFLNANDFHDAIETYRRRVEDLKMDFLIHVTGDCSLMLYDLIAEARKERNGAAHQDEIVIHIPLNRTTLFGLILFN